jgi:hypothetical protein
MAKPGPVAKIGPQVTFNSSLPADYRQRLEAYAEAHGISLAEALRRAIDTLTSPRPLSPGDVRAHGGK